MKISDLQDEQKNVNIGGRVIFISQTREVHLKSGDVQKVTPISIQDDSGSIVVNLWGDLINKIELNSEIRIEKAYVTKFHDNLQLNLGFYGKLFLLLNNTESV